MRVCLDLRYKIESGASSYIRNVVPELLALGTDASWIGVKYKGQEFPFEAAFDEMLVCPTRADAAHVTWTAAVLPFLLRSRRVDLYHSLKMPGPLLNPVPMVQTMHSVVRDKSGTFPASLGPLLYTYLYADFMVRRAERLIAVSTFVAENTRRIYGVDVAKMAVVPHGIDPRFRRMPAGDIAAVLDRLGIAPGFVLAVGNLFPVKNQLTTLRAFARIHDAFPGDLLLVGATDHPYAHAVRREIAKLDLQRRVRLLGYTPPDDIAALMNAASVLALPSLTEGCPVTLLEAMACGLPTVAARAGGLPEIGGDAVLFIDDPLDDAALAAQIQRLREDEPLRSSLVRKSQERGSRFSWRRAGGKSAFAWRLALPAATSAA